MLIFGNDKNKNGNKKLKNYNQDANMYVYTIYKTTEV